MLNDNWNKIKEIFQKAIELRSEERASYLQQACAGDESQRFAVESLIEAHEKSGKFMDAPAYEAIADLIVPSPELKAGEMIAHYEIRGLLGKGGMGKVYRAEDTKLKRDVALKVLAADVVPTDASRKRFLREARAAAALDHPNICSIYEVGEDGGDSYIAMPFIDGETLEQRLKHSPLSVIEILRVSIQVADALSTAHAHNIIHRDIKPANLIFTNRRDVKVLDFGIAKLVDHETGSLTEVQTQSILTQPGLILGTVPYMSPEQVRGQDVDARSDIWSLGVVTYEMITRCRPFTRVSVADTLGAILTAEPEPLSRYSSDVPVELQRIVGKMLRKNREERYQTAKDALIDLQDHLKQLEAGSKPALSQTLKRHALRSKIGGAVHDSSPWKRGLVLASLSLLALVAIVGVWRLSRTPRGRENPRLQGATQITTWPGLDVYPSLSPDGNTIAYSSDHNGSFEIYVRPLTPGARETQLTNDGQSNFQAVWSPDGQRIAYSSKKRGGIWITPSSGGSPKQVSQFGSHPAWSPNGSLIAFQSDPITDVSAQSAPSQPPSTIWVVPADGNGDPAQITQVGHPAGGHGAPAWSPDGNQLAICASDFGWSSIWIVDKSGTEAKQVVSYGFDPAFGHDGTSLYYTTLSGLWKIPITADTSSPAGPPIQISSTSSERIRSFAIAADSKKIVYTSMLTNSNLWFVPIAISSSTPNGPPVPLTQDRTFRNSIPIFSPDGKKIAFNTQKANRDRGEGDVWIMDADGKNPIQVTTEGGSLASWFPGGDQLAFLSYRDDRKLWNANLKTGQDKPMPLSFGEEVNYMRLSPDGTRLVFNSKRSGTTNVWTLSVAGGEPRQLTFDSELAGFACWSPDGKNLGVQIKRNDDTHIAVIASDGGPLTQLTFDKGQSWVSSFSPDGDKLVFAGFRDGSWNIWWVSRSTREQKRLTNYTKANTFVRYPNWSPQGNKIAYEYTETTGNIWLAEIR